MTRRAGSLFEFGLFAGVPRHENFCRIPELLPTTTLEPSSKPHRWTRGEPLEPPSTYRFAGETRSVIAVEEGHIADIAEPISSYVPVRKGSAYDGVSIKNVLQMSSGARWNEVACR